MEDDDDYPSEINDDLKWFNEKVEDVEETMKPLLDTSRNELVREVKHLDQSNFNKRTPSQWQKECCTMGLGWHFDNME